MTQTSSTYERNKNDLYETEPWAVDALLRVFPCVANQYVWEPAAGNHAIVNRLKDEYGCLVVATDIEMYNYRHDATIDFMSDVRLSGSKFAHIITNPPYGKQNRTAANFTRKALERSNEFVAMLLTAGFDSGSSRVDLFKNNNRFVGKIVLLDRLVLIPGTDKAGTVDHAWYVWGAPLNGRQPKIWYERKTS